VKHLICGVIENQLLALLQRSLSFIPYLLGLPIRQPIGHLLIGPVLLLIFPLIILVVVLLHDLLIIRDILLNLALELDLIAIFIIQLIRRLLYLLGCCLSDFDYLTWLSVVHVNITANFWVAWFFLLLAFTLGALSE